MMSYPYEHRSTGTHKDMLSYPSWHLWAAFRLDWRMIMCLRINSLCHSNVRSSQICISKSPSPRQPYWKARSLRSDNVIIYEPSRMALVAIRKIFQSLLPWENTVKKASSMRQKAGLLQTRSLLWTVGSEFLAVLSFLRCYKHLFTVAWAGSDSVD